ncbi:MAG TPA: pseudouridine synthase [Puia sp.]|nr:pseudouridine synthase [Puia sp.]
MKRKTDNFSKFYNKKRNSAIKEEFKQEKKAAKKERKEAIERHFEERRKTRTHNPPPQRTGRGGQPGQGEKSGYSSTGHSPQGGQPGHAGHGAPTGDQLPLNKYIAHGGICSRRDAADLIRAGKVTVNGKPVTEPGTKVLPTDTVKVAGKKVTISRNFVYILLNKPKDYITTTDDPEGRRTVLDLIRNATEERVFPVGRLDRNTSGVLLLTNDGDLSQKLAHPSHEIKKIYHVVLDKPLTRADFDKIMSGQLQLEDGVATVDAMAYEDAKDKTQIGLEIHSGRNRIVRRIFEHLGYDVRGLDRVMYAGLTKKNVQRGKWRLLTEREIRILKYLNSSIKGSPARAKEWAAIPKEAEELLEPAKAAKAAKTFPAGKTGHKSKPGFDKDRTRDRAFSRKEGGRATGRTASGKPPDGARGSDRRVPGKPAGGPARPAHTGRSTGHSKSRPGGAPQRKPSANRRHPK